MSDTPVDDGPAAVQPTRITLLSRSRALEISWADGHISVYPYPYLRWHCPCAECKGEFGRPGLLDIVDHLSPEKEALRQVELVGAYALQPVWQDGHDTGLFTFETLRDLCPCPTCDSERRMRWEQTERH